jgi:hypothetical protein
MERRMENVGAATQPFGCVLNQFYPHIPKAKQGGSITFSPGIFGEQPALIFVQKSPV